MFPGLSSRLEKDIRDEYCERVLRGGTNHIANSINVIVGMERRVDSRRSRIGSTRCSRERPSSPSTLRTVPISGSVVRNGRKEAPECWIGCNCSMACLLVIVSLWRIRSDS